MNDNGYNDPNEGPSAKHDQRIAFMITKLNELGGTVLDVGCNTGEFLTRLGRGQGVDASIQMVQIAQSRGRPIVHGWAESLPFADKSFDNVILMSILEQTKDWRVALAECRRVGKRVIGLTPYPGTPWGIPGHGWVKSAIAREEIHALGGKTEDCNAEVYYFEI
jgi:SAM-dependent methyltransferase